jgi:hypothetical protein
MPRERKVSSKMAFMLAADAEVEAAAKKYAAGATARAEKRKAKLALKREKARAEKAKLKAKLKKKKKKKPKKIKKKTKADGVKRALSAYMYYASEKRSVVVAENPDAGFGEVGRILGTWWRECSDDERERYEDLAKRDKIRYERDIRRGGSAIPRKVKKVKAAPKKKKVKKKKALKSWSNKDGEKSYYDMICEAILALKDRGGTSSIALTNYITNNNDIDFKSHVFRGALKKHTEAGRLIRIKNSYKLSPEEKKLALKRY